MQKESVWRHARRSYLTVGVGRPWSSDAREGRGRETGREIGGGNGGQVSLLQPRPLALRRSRRGASWKDHCHSTTGEDSALLHGVTRDHKNHLADRKRVTTTSGAIEMNGVACFCSSVACFLHPPTRRVAGPTHDKAHGKPCVAARAAPR